MARDHFAEVPETGWKSARASCDEFSDMLSHKYNDRMDWVGARQRLGLLQGPRMQAYVDTLCGVAYRCKGVASFVL